MAEPRFKQSIEIGGKNVAEKEPKHRCDSIGCMAGSGRYFRAGKWYCSLHTTERMKERDEKRKKREEKAKKVRDEKRNLYGFRIGNRIYQSRGNSEQHAWKRLFGKIVEIENLGELKS